MRSALGAVCLVVFLSSCGTTIVTPEADSTTSSTTTTTLPSGDTAAVLLAMLERMRGLSEIVVETGGERATTRLDEIETLWELARPDVERDHPTLLADFDRMISLCRLAVERRRPAEADKAYAFLTPLVARVSNPS